MPIKSLPQEWLWCETWCDDASKSKAKTIDLCNNPKTKEPKLTAARRILPEWEGYDNEIKELLENWKEGRRSNNVENRVEVEHVFNEGDNNQAGESNSEHSKSSHTEL